MKDLKVTQKNKTPKNPAISSRSQRIARKKTQPNKGLLPANAVRPRASFGTMEVLPGDTTWKLIERQLIKDPLFSGMSLAQQGFMVEMYEKRLRALSPTQLKNMGFTSGNIEHLYTKNIINLESFNGRARSHGADNRLTQRQQDIILNTTRALNVEQIVETPKEKFLGTYVTTSPSIKKSSVFTKNTHGRRSTKKAHTYSAK